MYVAQNFVVTCCNSKKEVKNMRSIITLLFLLISAQSVLSLRALKGKAGKGKIDKRGKGAKSGGLCVVGCTPYVNPDDETSGILKWEKLVEEMAESCAIMVHVGDTKAGAAPCNENIMVSFD